MHPVTCRIEIPALHTCESVHGKICKEACCTVREKSCQFPPEPEAVAATTSAPRTASSHQVAWPCSAKIALASLPLCGNSLRDALYWRCSLLAPMRNRQSARISGHHRPEERRNPSWARRPLEQSQSCLTRLGPSRGRRSAPSGASGPRPAHHPTPCSTPPRTVRGREVDPS